MRALSEVLAGFRIYDIVNVGLGYGRSEYIAFASTYVRSPETDERLMLPLKGSTGAERVPGS
jgi:hypothetical protein